jgi:predicted alpha/beta hydrolase
MEEINFDYHDGSKNSLLLYENIESTNILVMFPAMGVKANYYKPFIQELSQRHTIATIDLRGMGNSSLRPSKRTDYGYKETLDFEYHKTIEYLKNRYPDKRLILVGHSLGGQMGCLYTSKHPNYIDGIILIASCNVFYKGWKKSEATKNIFYIRFASFITSLLGYFPGHKLGFGGLQSKSIIKDWHKHSETGIYKIKGENFDFEYALSNTNTKILAIHYPKDHLCPKEAIYNLLNKFSKSSEITFLSINENNLDHFSWVKNNKSTILEIDNWLNR